MRRGRGGTPVRGGGEGSSFPYRFRRGQREAYESLRRGIESGGAICFQAPTGFGKTPVVLAALLDSGQRVLWTVRTGTETDRPVEELKKFRGGYRGISFRGKRDMCLLARDRMKGDADYEDVSYLCRRNRDVCPYYRNLSRYGRVPREPVLYSEILELAEEEGICPYYYQRRILWSMDVVSVNYNYVLNDAISWTLRGELSFRDMYLVVDEAHNLQFAAMNMFGDSITRGTLERARGELGELGGSPDVERAVDGIDAAIRAAIGPRKEARVRIRDVAAGIDGEVLREMKRLGERVRLMRLEGGERPRSSLWHLHSFISKSIEAADEEGVAFFASRIGDGYELERWDMRASEILAGIWGKFRGVIFMSGTLDPLDAFADVAGVGECSEVRADFEVKPDNVRAYVVRGISTKGERLGEEMRRRYGEVLGKFLADLSDRNVAVFSSSYRVQEELLGSLPPGILERAYVEREGMGGGESRKLLEAFKAAAGSGRKGILFASASGRFSEGADFPGEELEAAAMVGIPFERPTLKMRTYVGYYQGIYGRERGRYLAYVVPALRRAAQALGRVIRSEDDRGIFLLADGRYSRREYLELLPAFIRSNVRSVEYREFLSLDPGAVRGTSPEEGPGDLEREPGV